MIIPAYHNHVSLQIAEHLALSMANAPKGSKASGEEKDSLHILLQSDQGAPPCSDGKVRK